MDQTWEQVIDLVVRHFRLNGRVRWRGYDSSSCWGWVISPVPGYLETGDLGPVPVREIEWVDLDLTRKRKLPGSTNTDDSINTADVISALWAFRSHLDPVTTVLRAFPPDG